MVRKIFPIKILLFACLCAVLATDLYKRPNYVHAQLYPQKHWPVERWGTNDAGDLPNLEL